MTAGVYSETITATDSVGATTRRLVTITINPAISLVAVIPTLTTTVGVSITDTVTATSGTGDKTFSLTVSPAVSGITFTNTVANRAVITVANTVGPGNYTITLTATDSVSATSALAIPLVVNSGLTVSGSVALSSTAGYAFTSPAYSSSGGSGNTVFSLTGATGVRLSATTGTPTIIVPDTITSATYNLTLRVTDSLTASSTLAIVLKVNIPVTLNGDKTLSKVYGEELTQVYQTSAGTAPFNIFTSNVCTSEKDTYTADGTNGIAGQSYTVETFNGTGTCDWVAPTNVTLASVLVVAGGGGGGSRHAGGGGGGGVLLATNYSLTSGTAYSLSVGKGGAGATGGSSAGAGRAGQNSFFGGSTGATSLVANGGGGGAGGGEALNNLDYLNTTSNSSRGSGGGSNHSSVTGGSSVPGSAGGVARNAGSSSLTINSVVATIQAYGSAGAAGAASSACKDVTNGSGWCGGGGGGALESASIPALLTGNQWRGGNGGNGISLNISRSSVTYAGGGGGGAGSDDTYSNSAACISDSPREGFGGTGGGGNGSKCLNDGSNGSSGLGGGGGGGGYQYLSSGGNQNARGGTGGSGTVIVRYLTPAPDTSTTALTMTTLSTNPTGSLQLSAPRNLPVLVNNATYSQSVTVTDAVGSTGATPVTITLAVTKATPTISLSIPGGGTTATYGSPVSLTATSTIPGTFNFRKAGTSILGCNSRSTTNGQAICSWTPNDTSTSVISTVFTPTDSNNYNTVTSSDLTLTVLQAETLTVTFNAQTFTYTGSAALISRSYTLNGLSSIDSITAVTTVVTGSANDASSYNNSTSPTKAGTYSLTGSAVTFSGSTKASYYKGISYVAGTITINRAGNAITLNYGTNNTVTYKPTGTETATVTYLGDGVRTFESANSTYCTVDSSTGAMSTGQAGNCDVRLGVAQSTNYLGDTITASVLIKRAPRTITITSAANSLKYGETTTITTLVNNGPLDGFISYSNGSTTGCSYDSAANILTAISGTATCSITALIGVGTNYESATSTSISVTLNKANAPVVTLTAPASVDYSPIATASDMPEPTFSITGLKLNDTSTVLSDMTITYVATGSFTYNSTTVPTGANTYTIIPSALVLSNGTLGNYQTPTYVPASWTINKIVQDSLTVTSLFQEGISVPYEIQYVGGSTNGSVSLAIVSGGTATACSPLGMNLRASSTGTCVIQITMAGNQNYLNVSSETITVVIASFIQYILNFDNLASGSTAISITSEVPINVDVFQCSNDCIPEIASLSATTFQDGDQIVITGIDFANATEVIFNRKAFVSRDNGMSVDSNTQITVVVPSGLAISANGSISVKSGSKVSNRIIGLTITG
jgi:hypothetical protein